MEKLAESLGIGALTCQDIINELEKPSRDPREDMPKPILRSDVLEMKDLKPGLVLKGTVRNVIDFGCFVDIGVHQDGLVHISQICDRFIKHPLEAVKIGDIVDVKVLSVDMERKRIQLTMRLDEPLPGEEKKEAGEKKETDRRGSGNGQGRRMENRNGQGAGNAARGGREDRQDGRGCRGDAGNSRSSGNRDNRDNRSAGSRKPAGERERDNRATSRLFDILPEEFRR